MLVIGVWIGAIGVIVKFLVAEGRLGVLGVARKEKVGVFKLLLRRLAGNCTSQRLNPFAMSTTL